MKQKTDMVQSMVQNISELSPSSIKWQALFSPLAQHFTMKQLHNLTQDNSGKNESIVSDRFCLGESKFSRLSKGKNSMPTVIYYQMYLLEAMKRAINWILGPENLMTLLWGTSEFKLYNKDFLFPLIIHRKRQSNIFSSYVKEIKNCPTEERVRILSEFKIFYCLTGQDLNSKSVVWYVLATLVLYIISFLCRMIQK